MQFNGRMLRKLWFREEISSFPLRSWDYAVIHHNQWADRLVESARVETGNIRKLDRYFMLGCSLRIQTVLPSPT